MQRNLNLAVERIVAIKQNEEKNFSALHGQQLHKSNFRRLLTKVAGDKAEVYSAGVETHGVNPRAIETMKEDNIDISKHTSNTLTNIATVSSLINLLSIYASHISPSVNNV